MSGIIRKENNTVYIDDVPKFTYAIERDSFIQALRSITHVLGQAVFCENQCSPGTHKLPAGLFLPENARR
jgi:hypothetical protein